jgi:deoxyribodipyrimidine photo-lyase
VRAVHERARDPFLLTEEKISLRLFLRAFAQRDFFLQLAWYTEALGDAPLQPKMRAFRFARTHPLLGAWQAGRTGYPLVDAGIRELRATGWMHPRVRAIAASFLCFDLGVDWRVGRDEWDRWLIEDDPALATGNWQWIAGVGADLAAYPRVYNPVKQARRFDPAATYVRRWIPELTLQPDRAILDPSARRIERQLGFDLFGPQQYPPPVLDHERAARAFLARYSREVRGTAV